jgi:hypothetical protein
VPASAYFRNFRRLDLTSIKLAQPTRMSILGWARTADGPRPQRVVWCGALEIEPCL